MKYYNVLLSIYIFIMGSLCVIGCAAKMATEAGGITVDTGNPVMDILGLTFIIVAVYWAKKALDFRYMKKEEKFKKDFK